LGFMACVVVSRPLWRRDAADVKEAQIKRRRCEPTAGRQEAGAQESVVAAPTPSWRNAGARRPGTGRAGAVATAVRPSCPRTPLRP
jgi:hypothetical protein